jgi:hypothetical protein
MLAIAEHNLSSVSVDRFSTGPDVQVSFVRPRRGRYTVRMNITKMLAELREEREGVEQAILVLERLASGRGKRRGRPPAWMTQVKRRGRPKGSRNKPKDESV